MITIAPEPLVQLSLFDEPAPALEYGDDGAVVDWDALVQLSIP